MSPQSQLAHDRTYDIPYRSLIAREVEGLLMAGKCLSATHEAVASTRVIPICMAQGQAVSTAAAARSGVSLREISIDLLQSTLIEQGAEQRQSLEDGAPEIIDWVGQLPKDEPPTTGEMDEASRGVHAWIW